MRKKVEVRKLAADDLLAMSERGVSVGVITPEQMMDIERCPYARTVLIDDKVMMCGGVAEYWNNRGEAWAVFDPVCKEDFIILHKVSKRFLNLCPVKRIEAAVAVGFNPGHRWVKALGFKLEASRLTQFLPDGKDASLYAMVK